MLIKRPVRAQVVIWLVIGSAANLLLISAVAWPLKAVGAIAMFSVWPGLAAIQAVFPQADELDPWERLGLGLLLGVVLSTLATWLYLMAPGRLYFPVLLAILNGLAILLGALALWRLSRSATPAAWQFRPSAIGAMAVGLLALNAVLCFLWLDYAEYVQDETPILKDALASILGSEDAVYQLLKGPAQMVITTGFMLLGGNLSEGLTRAPFALTGIITALLIWRLARRLRGDGFALAVLALWLTEGAHLGESRWIQFQMLVLATALGAVLCYVLAERAGGGLRVRFQLLGAVLFAFGVFAHYDGVFVAPALALLWLWMERRALRDPATWRRAAVLAGTIALIALPFYVLMFTESADRVRRLGSYYIGFRLGGGPYNMMPDFFGYIRLLDSPAWIVVVAAGLLLACAGIMRAYLRRSVPLALLWGVCTAAALWAMLAPDALALGGVPIAFVPFGIMLGMLLIVEAPPIEVRVLGVWAMAAWFLPAFWMRVPGAHYYPALPALSLLAIVGWAWAGDALARRMSIRARSPAVAGAGAASVLLFISGAAYVYLMFISYQPEYADLYPDTVPGLLAPFAGQRPELVYNAYPHENGWRAVAALYARGTLRGEYDTNEFSNMSDWYLNSVWKPAQPSPRYFIHVLRPFAPILGKDVPADLPQTYWLAGRITVNGEPRMLVYQRKDGGPAPVAQTWAEESLSADWLGLTDIDRFVAFRDAGRDDAAFYAIAKRLEAAGRPGDAVIFDNAAGRELLARFYAGDVPLAASADDDAVRRALRVWGVYWSPPDVAVEQDVAETACPAASQWFNNVRLTLNGMGAYGPPSSVNALLGTAARLRTVALGGAIAAGSIVCVRLDWDPLGPTAVRYKEFVHLVGPDGRIAAQADAEPQSGFMPTVLWRAGAQFLDQIGLLVASDAMRGTYRLEAGLYDEATGARLPAVDARGVRYANDAVDLGTVELP